MSSTELGFCLFSEFEMQSTSAMSLMRGRPRLRLRPNARSSPNLRMMRVATSALPIVREFWPRFRRMLPRWTRSRLCLCSSGASSESERRGRRRDMTRRRWWRRWRRRGCADGHWDVVRQRYAWHFPFYRCARLQRFQQPFEFRIRWRAPHEATSNWICGLEVSEFECPIAVCPQRRKIAFRERTEQLQFPHVHSVPEFVSSKLSPGVLREWTRRQGTRARRLQKWRTAALRPLAERIHRQSWGYGRTQRYLRPIHNCQHIRRAAQLTGPALHAVGGASQWEAVEPRSCNRILEQIWTDINQKTAVKKNTAGAYRTQTFLVGQVSIRGTHKERVVA